MAKNPRTRNSRSLRRRVGNRPPYDRVLIVCEGEKTECNYFEEIRQNARISSAHVVVLPTDLGTDPRKVVESAQDVFNQKDKAFERVYAVFDRDDHPHYETAIQMAAAKNKKIKNDEKRLVEFETIVSVPCFELWLLLHFEDARSWIHRNVVLRKLRTHIDGYEKGMPNLFALTKSLLSVATGRATSLKLNHQRIPGEELYTDVHELVEYLISLKVPP
jgi:hypothetical protein